MKIKTGSAYLPLHTGKAPKWLFEKMVLLTKEISEIILEEYGRKEYVKRLSDPFFFQSFGCLVGFDWHSSGLTTTLTGAIKENERLLNEYNLFIAGGKGKEAIKTISKIEKIEEEENLSLQKVKEESKLVAKTDNSLLQDGYDLYHHFVIFDERNNYTIIQQGMNVNTKYARRYHWNNMKEEFNILDGTREGIQANQFEEKVLNLSSKKSKETRKMMIELIHDEIGKLLKNLEAQTSLDLFFKKEKILVMPKRHSLKFFHLTKKSKENLIRIWKENPQNFKELLMMKNVGKRTLRALALAAQLIYGSEIDWQDPAKFSFAHGGKDGWPYPVDKKTYENTIKILNDAIRNSKIGRKEKIKMLRKLATLT